MLTERLKNLKGPGGTVRRRLADNTPAKRAVSELIKRIETARAKRRKPKVDRALADTVSFLRNAAAGNALPSAEQVLTELTVFDNILSPGFAAMLSRLRQNDPKGALDAFVAVAGDREGADIGRLLIQWDSLEAAEVTETLLSYQRHLAEVRYTLNRKEDELTSDLLYIPVVANVMIVFINFIFVGYFLEQQELFELIF
jgi:hypothetical protein